MQMFYEDGRVVLLKEVKQGDYFKRVRRDGSVMATVYVRDEYDRSAKKYDVHKFCSMNEWGQLKGDTPVLVDFTF